MISDLSGVPWVVMAELSFVYSDSVREGHSASRLHHMKEGRNSAGTPVQPACQQKPWPAVLSEGAAPGS